LNILTNWREINPKDDHFHLLQVIPCLLKILEVFSFIFVNFLVVFVASYSMSCKNLKSLIGLVKACLKGPCSFKNQDATSNFDLFIAVSHQPAHWKVETRKERNS
jgi:hypothetical protein